MSDQVREDEHISLMLKFQAGDEAAFDTLVQAYKRSVMAVAYRFLQQQQDAEDAAQETFVRVYKARQHYRPGHRFSSWLFTILNHVCLNMIRHRKRHHTISLEKPMNMDGDTLTHHLPDRKEPLASDELIKNEAQTMVRKAVAELKPEERMAMILDHWENKSLAEIAEIIQKSVPAVKSMLFRARAKCKIKLQAYINEAEVE